MSVAVLGRPAPRPLNTSLVAKQWREAGFEPLRHWRDAAEAFLAEVLGPATPSPKLAR